jgi:hypothetical protein
VGGESKIMRRFIICNRSSPDIRMIKSRRMRWAVHVVCAWERREMRTKERPGRPSCKIDFQARQLH